MTSKKKTDKKKPSKRIVKKEEVKKILEQNKKQVVKDIKKKIQIIKKVIVEKKSIKKVSPEKKIIEEPIIEPPHMPDTQDLAQLEIKPTVTASIPAAIPAPAVTSPSIPIVPSTPVAISVEAKIPESVIEKKKTVKKETEQKILQRESDNSTLIQNSDNERQEEKNKVEALLFACGKYIDEEIISELCGVDKRKLKKILEELRKDYESKNNALMIFNEGNSWKINVREKYLSTVRKIVADTELPRSVMETLAVIAWKTPIYQSEVVRIRGNKCYDHIEVLEEAGFISKDKKGRSYVLKATDKFFNYFEIDRGNLKGVFDTVKVPELKEEQQTLEPADIISENDSDKVQAIELRKWSETEEEKQGHKQFLEQIEGKIREAHEKNVLFGQEIPKPTLGKPEEQIPQQQILQLSEVSESETQIDNAVADTTSEKSEEPMTENVSQSAIENVNQANQTQHEDRPHKPKSLTKKQLEKKFKDELIRVREKMEKKQK